MSDPIYTDRLRPYWSKESWINDTDGWEIVLPHQCDAWEIGSREDARRLIADLESLIAGDDPPSGGRYEWRPLDD